MLMILRCATRVLGM